MDVPAGAGFDGQEGCVEREAIAKDEAGSHRHSVPVRVLFAGLGALALALGVLGVFLPLLPTTPFLLLAAACFARASRRASRYLLEHPRFGPLIHEWSAHRSIPYRTKRRALALIALSFSVSIVFFVPGWPARLIMGAGGLILMAWIARIPSRDAPVRG